MFQYSSYLIINCQSAPQANHTCVFCLQSALSVISRASRTTPKSPVKQINEINMMHKILYHWKDFIAWGYNFSAVSLTCQSYLFIIFFAKAIISLIALLWFHVSCAYVILVFYILLYWCCSPEYSPSGRYKLGCLSAAPNSDNLSHIRIWSTCYSSG